MVPENTGVQCVSERCLLTGRCLQVSDRALLMCRITTKGSKYVPNVMAPVLLSVSVSDGLTMVKARRGAAHVAVLAKWFATHAMGAAQLCL